MASDVDGFENFRADTVLPLPGMDPVGREFYTDLEEQEKRNIRTRCQDECENALAQLPPGITDFLLGLFGRIAPGFLPSPLWQSQNLQTDEEPGHLNITSKCLRIAAAARLALATDENLQEPPLKAKVNRIYDTAKLYLDSIPHFDRIEDIESSLLLAELEFGRGQSTAARMRLHSVVATLSDESKIQRRFQLGNEDQISLARPLLRTAVLMKYWYVRDMPPATFWKPRPESRLYSTDSEISMEECFASAQLRLASLHAELNLYLEDQPKVNNHAWETCDQALTKCFSDLQTRLQDSEAKHHDSSVTFFVFGQQYLCIRIELQKTFAVHVRRPFSFEYNPDSTTFFNTYHTSTIDAMKIASGLRTFGSRYRFREAPLSFLHHIRTAAGVLLRSIETSAAEVDGSAFLDALTFFCDVLRYMSEVHEQAKVLLETLQQRVNSVLLLPQVETGESGTVHSGVSTPTRAVTPSRVPRFLGTSSKEGSRNSSRQRSPAKEQRPKSSGGARSSSRPRPQASRSTSTPDGLPTQKMLTKKNVGLLAGMLSPTSGPKQSQMKKESMEWQEQFDILKI